MQKHLMKIMFFLTLIYLGQSSEKQSISASLKKTRMKHPENKSNSMKGCRWICYAQGSAPDASKLTSYLSLQQISTLPSLHLTYVTTTAVPSINNERNKTTQSNSPKASNESSLNAILNTLLGGNAIAFTNSTKNGQAVANDGNVDIAVGNEPSASVNCGNTHKNGEAVTNGKNVDLANNNEPWASVHSGNAHKNGQAVANGGNVEITVGNGPSSINGNTQHSDGSSENGLNKGNVIIEGGQLGGDATAVSGKGQSALANGGNTTLIFGQNRIRVTKNNTLPVDLKSNIQKLV